MWRSNSNLESSLPSLTMLSSSLLELGTSTPSLTSFSNTQRTQDVSEIDDDMFSPLPFPNGSVHSASSARESEFRHGGTGLHQQSSVGAPFVNQYPPPPSPAIVESEEDMNPLPHTSQELSNHERSTLASDLEGIFDFEGLPPTPPFTSCDNHVVTANAVAQQQNQEGPSLDPSTHSLNISIHSNYSHASQRRDVAIDQRWHPGNSSFTCENNVSNRSTRSVVSYSSQQQSIGASGRFGLDECVRPGGISSSCTPLDDGSLHDGWANTSTRSIQSELSCSHHSHGRFVRTNFLPPAIPQQQSFGVGNLGPTHFDIPPHSSHSAAHDVLNDSIHSRCSSLVGHFQGFGIDDLSHSRRSTDYDSCYTTCTEGARSSAGEDIPPRIPTRSLSRGSEHSVFSQCYESFREDDDWDGFGEFPGDTHEIVESAPVQTTCHPTLELSPRIVSPTRSKRNKLDLSSQQPLELRDSDVLGGQGTGSAGRPSNQRYLEKVREMQGLYRSLEERDTKGKSAIAAEVYNFVHKELGGRFVVKKNESFFELPKKYVMEKIKRALRDKPPKTSKKGRRKDNF